MNDKLTIRNSKNSQGSVLVVAIVILALVMGIALAIGTLTVAEFKNTSEVASSNAALYGADTGVERALYEYNKNGADPGPKITYSETINTNVNYVVDLERSASAEGDLHQDEVKEFNLVNSNIQGVILKWDRSTNPSYNDPAKPAPEMLYKLVAFPNDPSFGIDEVVIKEGLCGLECSSGWVIPLDLLADTNDHLLRIKPLKNGARYEISVSPAGSGSFGKITITSQGSARQGVIKRALRTELSEDKASTGIWDFVLFSQDNL